jgi:hypothetical protein
MLKKTLQQLMYIEYELFYPMIFILVAICWEIWSRSSLPKYGIYGMNMITAITKSYNK